MFLLKTYFAPKMYILFRPQTAHFVCVKRHFVCKIGREFWQKVTLAHTSQTLTKRHKNKKCFTVKKIFSVKHSKINKL